MTGCSRLSCLPANEVECMIVVKPFIQWIKQCNIWWMFSCIWFSLFNPNISALNLLNSVLLIYWSVLGSDRLKSRWTWTRLQGGDLTSHSHLIKIILLAPFAFNSPVSGAQKIWEQSEKCFLLKESGVSQKIDWSFLIRDMYKIIHYRELTGIVQWMKMFM